MSNRNHINLLLLSAGYTKDNHEEWRACPNTPVGTIRGLPHITGHLLITNGVLALLDRGERTYFICHLDNFVKTEQPRGCGGYHNSPKQPKVEALLEDLLSC